MKTRRLNAHMEAAHTYAKLSWAKRLKVGAILIKNDRIISIGYNGMPSGSSNICEDVVIEGGFPEYTTKPEVIHAEMNAIAFAARNGIMTEGCSMITTHSPCFNCSKLLIQSGVKEIYYEKEYRKIGALKFLKDNNVKVRKHERTT